MRSKKQQIFWTFLSLAWILFIWSHSLVPGVGSAQESGRVCETLMPLFNFFGVSDWQVVDHIIRKTAHFLEYTVLGVLLSYTFYGEYHIAHAIPCILVPVCDEAIQLIVPGRSGQVSDVILDICGVIFGTIVAFLIIKCMRRIRKRR